MLRQLVRSVEFSGHALLPQSNEELLQSIVETAARIFGAPAASILLVNEKEQVLEFRVACGPVGRDVIGMKFPLDHGIAGYVAMSGQPMAIANVKDDTRFARDTAERTGYVPQSILAMPLVSDERVIGVIEVLDKVASPTFGMEDMELLSIFARQAAIAIHASQQFERLAETFVRGIAGLAGAEEGATFELAFGDVDTATDDPARSEMIQLAGLYNSLSALGSAERVACMQVLEAFAQYARRKNLLGQQ